MYFVLSKQHQSSDAIFLFRSFACRVHSIFVLRLFNDGVAMWFLYAAVYFMLLNRSLPP